MAGFKLSRFLIAFLAFVQIVAGNGVEAEVDIAPEDPKPVFLRVAPGSCPFNGGSEPSGEVEGGKVEVPATEAVAPIVSFETADGLVFNERASDRIKQFIAMLPSNMFNRFDPDAKHMLPARLAEELAALEDNKLTREQAEGVARHLLKEYIGIIINDPARMPITRGLLHYLGMFFFKTLLKNSDPQYLAPKPKLDLENPNELYDPEVMLASAGYNKHESHLDTADIIEEITNVALSEDAEPVEESVEQVEEVSEEVEEALDEALEEAEAEVEEALDEVLEEAEAEVEEALDEVLEEAEAEVKEALDEVLEEAEAEVEEALDEVLEEAEAEVEEAVEEVSEESEPHDAGLSIELGDVHEQPSLWERLFGDKYEDSDLELGKQRFHQILKRASQYTPKDECFEPYVHIVRGLDSRDNIVLPIDIAKKLGKVYLGRLPELLAWQISRYVADLLAEESISCDPDTYMNRVRWIAHRDEILHYIMKAIETPAWVEFY
ncbi:uncharacterized protein BXIN_2870 [Babesia sp. Xinjiang]|uniref:uncharacterized protein n=1 Tax=Babesia sp. Xinjiang TaxID=462227 RepID=UPI000A21D9BE|nr:uncharacterized protein BXIN_2870 [Babesia sp. Xinjiang]ORM39454.1 hypothetical protein BXIN_2870 [Babesia sp. Xinjiang]